MAFIRDTRDLGEFIRRTRKVRGYTQAQLAELAGVGVVYLGNLERGKETAEIGKALRILQLLSIDLEATDRQDEIAPEERAVATRPKGQGQSAHGPTPDWMQTYANAVGRSIPAVGIPLHASSTGNGEGGGA